MQKNVKSFAMWLAFLLGIYIIYSAAISTFATQEKMVYSDLVRAIKEEAVTNMVINDDSATVTIKDENGKDIYSNDSTPAEIYISYEHAHLFDSTDSFDLIYDLHLDSISNQIGANTIDTLGSQYPYVIYGQTNYLTGSIECLLVSEESATGSVNIHSEKELRKKILAFLNNKKCKVLKNEDGTYMLIEIIGTPTLIPSNEIIGIYQVNFQYIQIGNVDSITELQNANITFDYLKGSTEIKNNMLG